MILLPLIFTTATVFAANDAPVTAPETTTAFKQVQQGHAVLLDVREQDEIAQGAFKSAVKFPTSQLNTPEWGKFLSTLDKKKPIYVYCRSGRRAEKTAQLLKENGFNAKNIGGYDDIKKLENSAK